MALGIGYVPEDRKEHGLVLEMSIGRNITAGFASSVRVIASLPVSALLVLL